jgi:hypothetical protein
MPSIKNKLPTPIAQKHPHTFIFLSCLTVPTIQFGEYLSLWSLQTLFSLCRSTQIETHPTTTRDTILRVSSLSSLDTISPVWCGSACLYRASSSPVTFELTALLYACLNSGQTQRRQVQRSLYVFCWRQTISLNINHYGAILSFRCFALPTGSFLAMKGYCLRVPPTKSWNCCFMSRKSLPNFSIGLSSSMY